MIVYVRMFVVFILCYLYATALHDGIVGRQCRPVCRGSQHWRPTWRCRPVMSSQYVGRRFWQTEIAWCFCKTIISSSTPSTHFSSCFSCVFDH